MSKSKREKSCACCGRETTTFMCAPCRAHHSSNVIPRECPIYQADERERAAWIARQPTATADVSEAGRRLAASLE